MIHPVPACTRHAGPLVRRSNRAASVTGHCSPRPVRWFSSRIGLIVLERTLGALGLAAIVSEVLFPADFAQADIIRCSFTEPFIETTYSTTDSTLAIKYSAEGRSEILKNISLQI